MKNFLKQFKLTKYIIRPISLLSVLVFSSNLLYGQELNTFINTTNDDNFKLNYQEMRTTHILGSSTKLCTGVSIGQSALLTTADCVLGVDVPILIEPDVGFKNYKKILPKKVYIHPLYDSNKNKFQYNLAVLIYSDYIPKFAEDEDDAPAFVHLSFDKVKLFQYPLFSDPYSSSTPVNFLQNNSKPLTINTYSINENIYNTNSYFNYRKIIINTRTLSLSPIEYYTNEPTFNKSQSTANSSVLVREYSCTEQEDGSLKHCSDQYSTTKMNLNKGSGLFYNNELVAIYSGSIQTRKDNYSNIVNIKEYWNTIVNSDTYNFLKEIVKDISIVNTEK